MKRLTIRSGFTGETYLTGEVDVCWANRPIEERAFCTGCHRLLAFLLFKDTSGEDELRRICAELERIADELKRREQDG